MNYKLDKGAHIKGDTKALSESKGTVMGWVFWSPSYFLATTGQVTLGALKRYVEGQGKHATDSTD